MGEQHYYHTKEWDNQNNYSHQTFGSWSKKTINVVMLRLLEWHHIWRRRYHLYYKAKIVLNKNNQFTWNNSICENDRCGDHGYKCEDYYFITRIWSTKHRKEDTWCEVTFLSLYSRFFEVTIFESTYAIGEGKKM